MWKLTFALVLMCVFVFALNFRSFTAPRDVSRPADFFEMSLEELMKIEVT